MAATASGTYYNGVTLDSVSENPLTIATTGVVLTTDVRAAVYGEKGVAWTVINKGLVFGNENLAFKYYGVGIGLGSGGTVTNMAGAYLHGYGTGVQMYSGGGMVTNAGTIKGGPLGTLFTGGAPESANFAFKGVYIEGAAGAIVNSGYIYGLGEKTGYGVDLTAGGSVTNLAGGTIRGAADLSGGSTVGVDIAGAAGTVVNSGILLGVTAIDLKVGGSVTNMAGGVIDGDVVGVFIGSAGGTVVNSDIIAATGTYHLDTGTLVAKEAVGILLTAGSVVNFGVVEGLGSDGYGIGVSNGLGSVSNYGTTTGAGNDGILLQSGGSIKNGASKSSGARIAGALNGVGISGAAGAVTNFGTIESTGTSSDGILLAAGGSVANGTNGSTGASISGMLNGVAIGGATGKITNFGAITGSMGVMFGTTASATLTNSGTITGKGGTAVSFGGGKDLLVVEKGAVFVGAVLGDGAGEIKFAGTGTAAMASNISGFSIVVLADGGADRLTLVSANLTGVTGGVITVEGGNDGNTLSEAGVARADDAILKGGAGNDTLIAGRHAAMTGGLGADVFELTTPGATTTPNENKNKITDFTPGTDEIAFSDAGFKLGLSGASSTPQALPVDLFSSKTNGTFDNAGERFAYNATNGRLYYDAQGNTAGSSRELVATLSGHPALAATDLFYVT